MRGRHGDLRLFPRLARPQSARLTHGGAPEVSRNWPHFDSTPDFPRGLCIPAPLRRPNTCPRPYTPPLPQSASEEAIRPHTGLSQALGLLSRNLVYAPEPPPQSQIQMEKSALLEQYGLGPVCSAAAQNAPKAAPPAMPVRVLRETQYLVAPGLASNFYYNLVSWDVSRNSVAVAVAEAVYLWDGAGSIERVGSVALAVVCCVACSGDYTVVASSDGVVAVLGRGRRVARKFGAAVQCVRWLPREKHFLAGTAAGDVMCLCAGDTLIVVGHMPGLTQQICGTCYFSLTRAKQVLQFSSTNQRNRRQCQRDPCGRGRQRKRSPSLGYLGSRRPNSSTPTRPYFRSKGPSVLSLGTLASSAGRRKQRPAPSLLAHSFRDNACAGFHRQSDPVHSLVMVSEGVGGDVRVSGGTHAAHECICVP